MKKTMLEKIESQIKHDWFSDAVTNAFDSVGINTDIRNSLQPTVDHAVSLLPQGGAVSPPPPAIGSIPQATGYRFQTNISPIVLAAVAGLIVLALVMKK